MIGSLPETIFLLSPANTAGKRAELLLRENAQFDMARAIKSDSASLGEVFSFLSGLYFRGKLKYSLTFSGASTGSVGPLVITSNRGLLEHSTPVRHSDLKSFADTDINPCNDAYTIPLRRDCLELRSRLSARSSVVLLGSIASDKYFPILKHIFGDQLLFPLEFIGRGDMSRGGLLLRAAAANEQLVYLRATEVLTRKGKRPAKLATAAIKRM